MKSVWGPYWEVSKVKVTAKELRAEIEPDAGVTVSQLGTPVFTCQFSVLPEFWMVKVCEAGLAPNVVVTFTAPGKTLNFCA